MRSILFTLTLFISFNCFSQYIGVKARYADTRLVDNSPEPPSRENQLILSFYEVSAAGIYTPVTLTNFDIWVYKEGLHYGSMMGGVYDSTGNTYPGYAYTAPHAVAYYNSYGPNYIDCNPNLATHYVVNGHELDCGFIRVSSWEAGNESFTAPNVCLPYYMAGHPYSISPGNVNFTWPMPPTAPYNWYSFACSGSSQQLIIRGVLPQDSVSLVSLPVKFANVKGEINSSGLVKLSWSNMTESDVVRYVIESSGDGNSFHSIGTVLPMVNNGGRADYLFITMQQDYRAFYRIKAVENTGNSIYTMILVLTKRGELRLFSVYPNPVTNGPFVFRLTSADKGEYGLSIIGPSGQTVRQTFLTHSGGDITRQADLSGLPQGMYQIVLRSENSIHSKKIVYVY